MAGSKSTPFKALRKQWNILFLAATWVATTLAGFWVPPPAELANDHQAELKFARFIIAIFIALIALPMVKWRLTRHAFGWVIGAAAGLVLGIGGYLTAQYLQSIWTAHYQGKTIYIGSTLLESAKAYKQGNPQCSNDCLLFDAAGDPALVWTGDSIVRSRLILLSVYLLCTPVFAFCMLSAAQSLFCASGRRPTR
jgi:hypothetical protein